MNKTPSIQSIGTAVPVNKISQVLHYSILESANGLTREEKLKMRMIYHRSGIKYRYSVLEEFGRKEQEDNILFYPSNNHPATAVSVRMDMYEKYAIELCEEAVLNCLENIPALSYSQISHVITFSCTGMSAPGIDIQLIERLGLSRNVERTCINFMGCQAAVNALKVANYISLTNSNAIILIAGVELCTLHYQKSDGDDQMLANALFADGAAAAIISRKDLQDSDNVKLNLRSFYSEFDPAGKGEMVWRIGDFGFDIRLSAYVPDLIKNKIQELIDKLFMINDLDKNDIDFYALHPGGIKILEACENALQISKGQNEISYKILNEYGNMSSVTILFVLQEYFNKLTANDIGKRILGCAFGPGLSMEAMILEIE
ncbi:MAG: type III polyketide synthase [Fimbriimonadaceae bacterium]|nr:type III polyketide synthase [Chitinophagales bacterium]